MAAGSRGSPVVSVGCRTWYGTGAPACWSGPDRRRISHGPWSRCCSTRQRRRSRGAAGGTSRPRTRTATWSTAWRRCTAPWPDRPSPQADARAGPGPGPVPGLAASLRGVGGGALRSDSAEAVDRGQVVGAFGGVADAEAFGGGQGEHADLAGGAGGGGGGGG